MGILMESSQVNIHARPEQNPMNYYITNKCGDRLMMPVMVEQPLSLVVRDRDREERVPENLSCKTSDHRTDADYYPAYWNASLRYNLQEKSIPSMLSRGRWSPYNPTTAHEHVYNDKLDPIMPGGTLLCDVSIKEEPRAPSPCTKSMPPPKKKWIKNYMEEEPSCPPTVLPHHNGIRVGPPPASAPIAVPSPSMPGGFAASLSALPALLADSGSDLPRARSNSNGSSGPRAGTREVHNKLEKNRRAHLKECFETLRHQLPSSPDDKKSSNLSILDSAIKYIQVLKRRDKELEHEKERTVKEIIANQQKLLVLKRDSPGHQRQRHLTNHDRESSMEVDDIISSRVSPLHMSPSSNNTAAHAHSTNMDISITSRTSPISRLSPPSIQSPTNTSLDLTTRSSRLGQSSPKQIPNMHSNSSAAIYSHIGSSPLHAISPRTQAAQIIGSYPQHNGIVTNSKTLNLSLSSIRGSKVGSAPSTLPTLTVTSVNPGSIVTVNQAQSIKQGHSHNQQQSLAMSSSVNGQTAIVHPAQLQLSQVMNGGGLVVNPTIQLFSTTTQGLRVLQTQGGALASIDLPSTAANSPIQRMRDAQKTSEPGVGVSGVNGMRGSGDKQRSGHHHIAIKPQPTLNPGLRATNTQGGVTHMVNGLTPLVVSQGGTHIMTAPSHITGKVMSGPLMKSGVSQHIPLAVNAQYLSTATIVKPVVVVSTNNGVPPTSSTSSSSSS